MRRLLYVSALLFIIALNIAINKPQPAFADNVYFTSSPSNYVDTGKEYSYTITATSVNGYTVTYSFKSLPSWLSFNSSTDTISGSTQTAGRYDVDIFASDGHGSQEEQGFYIYVTQSPTPTPSAMKATPTAQPTSTIPPVKSTPTPNAKAKQTPTQTPVAPSPTPINTNTIILSNRTPADNTTTSNTTVTISATLHTGFIINTADLNIFFDNIDITSKASLVSTNQAPSVYTSMFAFKAINLSYGKHNINLTITNPNGIIVPESWSFTVAKATPKPQTDIQKILSDFLTKQTAAVVILGLAIYSVLLIIFNTLRHRPKAPKPGNQVQPPVKK